MRPRGALIWIKAHPLATRLTSTYDPQLDTEDPRDTPDMRPSCLPETDVMEREILQRYDRAVPRYTSYPTAPHWQPGVAAETYRDWLAAIGDGDQCSLYFHVPFCAAMCWFCGCHTKIVNRYRPVADYAAVLRQEVALVAGAIPEVPVVTHVHWGGGTPTMLSPRDFSSLMETTRRHFRLADDAEVAVEIDPRTLTKSMASALSTAGINRASIGVQDFNAHVQKAVNRIQPYEITERAVAWLRNARINAINFDLMYGLPGQSVDDAIRSVDLAHTLAPDRMAVFGYAHVPWMKPHQRMIDEEALPGRSERMNQANAVATRLAEHGYRRIGLDHFARADDALAMALDQGRLRRNFQGYTTDPASVLLGFGASAIGSLPQGYMQNTAPLRAYARCIQDGRFAVIRGIELTADDRLRRAVIERLMCALKVDLAATAASFGMAERFEPELDALVSMEAVGLVEVKGSRIRVTEKGRPLMRTVAAVFDRYLETGGTRHSHAI